MTGAVVVTMAGFGSRFRDAGYDLPKYRIEAHGRTLFDWSMLSLDGFRRAGWRFHFVARRDDGAGDFVAARAAALGIEAPAVTELDAPTDGQATTALLAGPSVGDADAPFVVYNIDTFVHPRALAPGDVRGDGWIPVADLPGDAWSFARADAGGRARELREKRRISDHATIGLYHFASFALYRDVYAAHFTGGAGDEAGERYIAPMYNTLIGDGGAVFVHEVARADFHALGTPADVEAFRTRTPPAV